MQTANFIHFLNALNVKAVDTEMTFGVTRDAGAFEWSGTSLGAVFAQRRNLFNPRVWRMLFDVIRFNQFALDLLWDADESGSDPTSGASTTNGDWHVGNTSTHKQRVQADESIGAYLERQGYSAAFRDDYLIPMTAAVWSTSPDKCALDFPALTLVRFMWNHHLLTTVAARPAWMTLSGGAHHYIDAVMRHVGAGNVHLGKRVTALENTAAGAVTLNFEDGGEDEFDHVVLACHGDQALEIIRGSATQEEVDVLKHFTTTENTAVLHSDLSVSFSI